VVPTNAHGWSPITIAAKVMLAIFVLVLSSVEFVGMYALVCWCLAMTASPAVAEAFYPK
jgi:hypothetical protein